MKKTVSKYLKKLNKYFFRSVLFFICIILIIYTLFYFNQNKKEIYFKIGNGFFGGQFFKNQLISSASLYNVDMASKFFKLSKDVSNNKKEKDLQWVNYQLSRTEFIKGNLYNAVIYADKEIELYPDNCRTYYIRGLAYGYLEDLDNAIKDFEKFNGVCVKNSWAGHNDLAWFWFRKGNMEKVVSVISEVKDIYPENPWLMNTYGTALMNQKKYGEAIKYLEIAKISSGKMSEKDWGAAYPGNNPKVYAEGLSAMRQNIDDNITLANNLIKKSISK